MTESDARPEIGQQIILPAGVTVSIKTEESPDDARHRRRKDTILFATSLTLLMAVLIAAGCYAFLGGGDPEQRRAATGILVTIVGGFVGFLGGRASK